MYDSNKLAEIRRLVDAFETEAGKFHDLQFHTFLLRQGGPVPPSKFAPQNQAVPLWQYYGALDSDADKERLFADLKESGDLKWGLRGAELSLFGVIEGETTSLFVRMATRAGSLFSEEEARYIKGRVLSEIQDSERKKRTGRPTGVVNDNPLAIWLNFLLYHLSMTTGKEPTHRIDPDPFALSLIALERLLVDQAIGKVDRSSRNLAEIHFKVALSFPGEKRRYVSRVADALRGRLGKDAVFYDWDYQAQLARPNLDALLQKIYRDQSDLIVVFLCAQYNLKQWCGLELRAVRDIIKAKDDHRIMFVRFDEEKVEGVFSIDGYIDARHNTAQQVADFILERLAPGKR
jgi:hypothetical protein